MADLGSVVGIGAPLLGSFFERSAAEDAADTQSQAANQAGRQYSEAAARAADQQIAAGNEAADRQMAAGNQAADFQLRTMEQAVGDQRATTTEALTAQDAALRTSIANMERAAQRSEAGLGEETERALQDQYGSLRYGLDAIGQGARFAQQYGQENFNRTADQLAPWRDVGSRALANLESTINQQRSTPFNFETSPGYQWRQDEGMRAVTNAATAGGMANSGRALKGAQRFGQGLAADEYGAAYNRWRDQQQRDIGNLSGLADRGMGAGYQIEQYRANMGNRLISDTMNARSQMAGLHAAAGHGMAGTRMAGAGAQTAVRMRGAETQAGTRMGSVGAGNQYRLGSQGLMNQYRLGATGQANQYRLGSMGQANQYQLGSMGQANQYRLGASQATGEYGTQSANALAAGRVGGANALSRGLDDAAGYYQLQSILNSGKPSGGGAGGASKAPMSARPMRARTF